MAEIKIHTLGKIDPNTHRRYLHVVNDEKVLFEMSIEQARAFAKGIEATIAILEAWKPGEGEAGHG